MVALAVMAFGMLALVGVQATLRMNNDLAKQRSEATLIATDEVERLRNYFTLLPVNGQVGISWTEITGHAAADYTPPEGIGNTTYQVARTVNTDAATRQKTFKVEVTWPDRTGVIQRVVLDGMVWGAVPELSTLLAIPTHPSAVNQINGRNVTIPTGDRVVDVGGKSHFTPPGSTNVVWVFDRATGVLNVCTPGNLNNCPLARFVSGEVRFHLAGSTSAEDAEKPQGPSLNLADGPGAMAVDVVGGSIPPPVGSRCYADPYTAAQLLEAALPRVTSIKYYCAVLPPDSRGWGGKLNPMLVDPAGQNINANYQICRYTTAPGKYTSNENHPETYCDIASTTIGDSASCSRTRVNENLINQNFLVIRGGQACPWDASPNKQTQRHLPP